jgi:lipocalin
VFCKLLLISVPVVTLAVGCGTFYPPLDVVEPVDLTQYTGKWYEIARYPTFFQAACVSSTAEYTARDDEQDVSTAVQSHQAKRDRNDRAGRTRILQRHC